MLNLLQCVRAELSGDILNHLEKGGISPMFLLTQNSLMPQNISSDFSLQKSGESFALIGTDVSAEAERLSVSDVNRLVPEKVFVIPSFIAKHHFTLGIKESKTDVTEAVTYKDQ